MPGLVMNAAAVTLCAHGGLGSPTAPNPRVKVGGSPVVVQPVPWAVEGCTNMPLPLGAGPCITAIWVTGSTRVTVEGMPVLLASSEAECVPTGTPLSVVFPGQERVTAT